MNIVSASDERYLPGLFVTWGSILRYSNIAPVFHLIHENLSEDRLQHFERELRDIGKSFRFEPVKMDASMFESFPDFFYASRMPYARLLIPELLDVRRALYVDTDILFLRGIEQISDFDLAGAPIGVVEEWGYDGEDDSKLFHVERCEVLNHRYFNSGLLLMDLEKIRQGDFFHKALHWIRESPERCIWWDQSGLNVALAGACCYLDPNLNFQLKPGRDVSVGQLDQIGSRNINIHYVTGSKPWIKPNQSVPHRVYAAVEARLRRDDAAMNECLKRWPIIVDATIHLIKGTRLTISKTFTKRARSQTLGRLAGEHFRLGKQRFAEAYHNRKIVAVLKSL